MPNTKIQEIIVVEGRNDTVAVRRAVDADTIETRGSAIPDHVLLEIEWALRKRGVIVLTDPDGAGERIRRIISQALPTVKHAFLPRAEATGKRNLGIENASPEAIREALAHVHTWDESSDGNPSIEWEDYLAWGFAGHKDSRQLREQVADKLKIGYGNAKQFYRRLCMFHFSKHEILEALNQVRKEHQT